MAFNPVEYLKEGKVNFVFGLTIYDRKTLIKWVRENEYKYDVINGFLELLKDKDSKFCFDIIYDLDEYKETVLYLLEKYKFCEIDLEKLINILNNTSWGKFYVLNKLEEYILDEEKYKAILEYIFSDFDNNQEFIQKLYLHPNLHIRFLFMKFLIKKSPDKINAVYDDITKYLTSYTHREFEQMTFLPELMPREDISSLAFTCLKKLDDKTLWYKFKEHILTNYHDNDLARLLLEKKNYFENKDPEDLEEFKSDADRLFETSYDYKFYISSKYEKLISEEIINEFLRYISYFKGNKEYFISVGNIYDHGLGRKLETYIDKYLSMSKNTTYEYLTHGSTSSCYRIGDFVFKLNSTKWSYEDVICPDLYLILPNLEEDFIRNKYGIVEAGIEIQKYLSKKARNLPHDVYAFFREELKRLGYYMTDNLTNPIWGDNCMLLDNYKDAYCHDPELLPDLFKQYPMVLVDRDRVYKLENRNPKQLCQSWD